MKFLSLFALALFCWPQQAASDLDTIRAEPQPEKRYWKALEYASAQIDAARKSYNAGELEAYRTALSHVSQGAELCDKTLRDTGKNPSKNPKHFKRAELKMREILRRLKGLEDEVGFEERPEAMKARSSVNEIHDELLFDIMGRRKGTK